VHEVVVLNRCVFRVVLDIRKQGCDLRAYSFKGIAFEIAVDFRFVEDSLGALTIAVNCKLVRVAAPVQLCVLVELV
jgi:hypothetical protein